MNKKRLAAFVFPTLFITWLSWGSIVVANQFGGLTYGTPLFMVLYLLGGLSPTIVAIFVVLKQKMMKPKQLLKTIFAVKQPVAMYACMLGLFALLACVGILTGFFEYKAPIYMAILGIIPMIIGGGLEEVGWRFVMQPELEKKLPFFAATLVTGTVWALWHWPLFLITGASQYGQSFPLFFVMCLGLAFALAAIYRLGKSVWLCILFHAFFNAMLESLKENIQSFNEYFIPVSITAAVMIIASCLVVVLNSRHGKAK